VGLDRIPAVTSDSYLRGEMTSAFTPRCGVAAAAELRTDLFVLRNGLHVVQRPEVAVVDGGGNPIADAELRQHFRLVD